MRPWSSRNDWIFSPKDVEFSLLEEVLKVLKPFKDVTVQVSAEKYVIISAIRPLLHHLTENALKVEGSDSLAVQMMKEERISVRDIRD